MSEKKEIAIIGGGLAGLVSSILLSRAGFKTLLIEKKNYPFHRVCGEYISNEVVPFLTKEKLYPNDTKLPQINRFQLTSTHGLTHTITLPLGGFGISRHYFDAHLFKIAEDFGVEVLQGANVTTVNHDSLFSLILENGTEYESDIVIGSFGKRSNLDRSLKRKFFTQKSPYLAVKYHIKTDHPKDLITLHNFKNGYCGISKVEGDSYNLCYLSHRDNLKATGGIKNMEEQVLFQNPFLKKLFKNSDFIFEKPLAINEISFRTKTLSENGVIMCGDSAGMITPLCGNGMAIAIHSAKILSETIIDHKHQGLDHLKIERDYSMAWRKQFSRRLMVGRAVQNLFGGAVTSSLAVQIIKTDLGKFLVGLTHGKPF